MDPERSHNFQEMIVRASESARLDHQIVFTTSMLNPTLEDEKYLIEPHYTHDMRTLSLASSEI
jgi:hypothetical protein